MADDPLAKFDGVTTALTQAAATDEGKVLGLATPIADIATLKTAFSDLKAKHTALEDKHAALKACLQSGVDAASAPSLALTPAAAEQSIRVLLAFFAALVGFCLKNLLDRPVPTGGMAAFFIALAMCLRFLTGAANHLWREHAYKGVLGSGKLAYAFNVLFVVLFGIVAVFMSYATSSDHFFGYAAILPTAALLWGYVDGGRARAPASGDPRGPTPWGFWRPLNWVHLFAFGVSWACVEAPGWGIPPLFSWLTVTWAWWLLFAASAVLLAFDFMGQLRALKT